MADLSPVPTRVIELVNTYIRTERSDWETWENRSPLDSSGVYSLHALARAIYAAGWTEGYLACAEVSRGEVTG